MTSRSQRRLVSLAAVALSLALSLPTLTSAEIVYLKNGDVIRGSVTGASQGRLTVETPYGRLAIPKEDILRIEYTEGEEPDVDIAEAPVVREETRSAGDRTGSLARRDRPEIELEIRGRSFWYAFETSENQPADLRIRLRFFVGDSLAATLLDAKPDTVDGNTYYNSFTFSPTDSQVVGTEEGYTCRVVEAGDGRVLLEMRLPKEQLEGQVLVRMRYEVNEGTEEFPQWQEAVSRAFAVPVRPGRRTRVVLEQNASGLEYSGFFRKRMKNLETFGVSVLSATVEEPTSGGLDEAR